MKRLRLVSGFMAPIMAFLGIGVAIYINRSWWRFTENALSDLGKLGLTHNWVFNASLVITAVLGVYYATGLLERAENAIERAGLWIFIAGLAFLAMIGLFPEGTAPHYYVSWAFFLVSAAGMAVLGTGFILSRKKNLGVTTFAILAAGIPLAFWAKGHFKGVAVAETIGAVSIALWHYVVLLTLARKDQ